MEKKKKLKEFVNEAIHNLFSDDLPLFGMETWNSGYVDELTDSAIGIFRLQVHLHEMSWGKFSSESFIDQIGEGVGVAPDYTRYEDQDIILVWLDEAACKMTVEYGGEDEVCLD